MRQPSAHSRAYSAKLRTHPAWHPRRSIPAELALRTLAHELRTQDNAITADPVFVVQQRRRDVGYDPRYIDDTCWVNGEEIVAHDTHPDRWAKMEAGHYGEPWPREEEGDDDQWTRTAYVDRWEFVQAFLTRAAAENFRKAQAHNLGETRVYVESAYRNPEWRLLRAIIENAPPRRRRR